MAGGRLRGISVLLGRTAVGIALCANGGCQLVIGDSIPSFRCHAGPDSCPTDAVCVPATGECVPRAGVCTATSCTATERCDPATLACVPLDASAVTGEATSPDAVVPSDVVAETGFDATEAGEEAGDATMEAPGPCHGLGCRCSGDTDCDSHICGDQLSVTSSVFAAAGHANFCTKPCCTSADCDPATACFASAAGGSYCIPAEWAGRSPVLGTAPGGQRCVAAAECRSGVCSAGTCADTCCAALRASTQCAAGTTCRFGLFPGQGFDTHYAAYCAPPAGLGATGASCQNPTDCQSGFCNALVCRDACENAGDCPASQTCSYAATPTPAQDPGLLAACKAGQGRAVQGDACTAASDCVSGFCDPISHQCSDLCFRDSDCTTPGWRCRPELVTVWGGSFSVLCCGS